MTESRKQIVYRGGKGLVAQMGVVPAGDTRVGMPKQF